MRPPRCARALDRGDGLGGDPVPLGMHRVRRDVVDLHRQEGSCAHVQRHPRRLDARRLQRVEERRVEVQSRRRRGDRPGVAGIHGLVAGFVGTGRRARDVRRQRDRGVGGEVVGKRCHAGEAQPEESVVAPDDGRLDGARKDDRLARTGGVAGTDLEEALVEAQHPLQQEFNPAAGGLGADEPRLHDPGVVQHQEVAGAEQARQVAETAIGRAPRRRGAGAGCRCARQAVSGRSGPAAVRSRSRTACSRRMPWTSAGVWCRERESNPHGLAAGRF